MANSQQSKEYLIENAFDFLETAIGQIKESPKYSVINFCVAVELILKARLMHEHWSLIVSEKNFNIEGFKSGKCKSINFKEIIPRIKSVTGENISVEAENCFQVLAEHRNKAIHFFHSAYSHQEQEKLLEKIAIEQFNGWYYLHELLKKWDEIFSSHNSKIQAIEHKIKDYDLYLNTVFERIKPKIQSSIDSGINFKDCVRCKKRASEEKKLTEELFNYTCHVCSFEEAVIKIECPKEGGKKNIIIDENNIDNIECTNCLYHVKKEELKDVLNTEYTRPGDPDIGEVSCAMCSNSFSVVSHHEYYICIECLYITKHIEYCDWCSTPQVGAGNLEDSYGFGCDFCEGDVGNHRD